jgi:KaiC/GvpD/RAD55 family RecA-like ATPase
MNDLRIPSCIPDLDEIIMGGFPPGSVILLFGDVGAGHNEFAYSTIFKVSIGMHDPSRWSFFIGRRYENCLLPKALHYISLSRSKDEIQSEIKAGFSKEFADQFIRHVRIHDFSSIYFKRSIIPASWTSDDELFTKSKNLIELLIDTFQKDGPDSLIVLDSLTDLASYKELSPDDLIKFLKGLRISSKQWKGVIYLLLTKDILDKRLETHILDCVDGVLSFEWNRNLGASRRLRYFYIPKFISVLPHIDSMRIMRFNSIVTANDGFIVLNVEKI